MNTSRMRTLNTHPSRSFAVGIVVCIVAVFFSAALIWHSEKLRDQAERSKVINLTVDYAHAIQKSIERSISSTYALAAMVRQGNGRVPDFDEIARQMLPFYPGATLQLAPDGIVKNIMPLKGNEDAIGHDIFKDPERAKEAILAKETGKLTLAGPFNLKQGGVGAVARLPVNIDNDRGQQTFWGFTIVLIRFPETLESARLSRLITQGFQYELWRIHPDTGKKQVITASSSSPPVKPANQTLKLPNGSWTLSVSPSKGWGDPLGFSLKTALGLIFSLMLGYMAMLMIRMKEHERGLEEQILLRTFDLEEEVEVRKHAEAISHSNETHFRTLLDTIPDLIWVKDADGVYLSCNAIFERFFGAKEADIVGKTDYDFVDKKLADSFREYDRKAMAAGKPSNNEEWITFPDDGQRVLLYITKTPMHNENGTLIGVLGIGRDISEIKRSEEEKIKFEGRLQQTQKMESVGRLAGGVAHDFNNMLGVILGHVHFALMETDSHQPLHANLEEIRKAAERSADLTRQLLAFARKQTIAPKVLNLNEIVSGILKMLHRLIGEDIQLTWQPSADLWPVKVDPSQIDQILANLCVNSRDSINDIGKITIETYNSTIDENYYVNNPDAVPGEYVTLSVSDDGCGMDKETMAHIFEPFFTTKVVGEGTGLGLATVFGAVKQNNGFINVYSEPGLGSRFTIYIPRHTGKTRQIPTEEATIEIPRGQESILLVEDEPAILKMVSMILTRHGYTVLQANTPSDAVRLAKGNSNAIHLLITDVVMPEMNGLDLAKELQSLYPHLKCLFMSGYTADVIAHHGVLDEEVHFIQKPFSLTELAIKVREVLDDQS